MPKYQCLKDITLNLREKPEDVLRATPFFAGQTYEKTYALPTGALYNGETYFMETDPNPIVDRGYHFSSILDSGAGNMACNIPFRKGKQIVFIAALADSVFAIGGDPTLLYLGQGVSMSSDLGYNYNSKVTLVEGKLYISVEEA